MSWSSSFTSKTLFAGQSDQRSFYDFFLFLVKGFLCLGRDNDLQFSHIIFLDNNCRQGQYTTFSARFDTIDVGRTSMGPQGLKKLSCPEPWANTVHYLKKYETLAVPIGPPKVHL